MRCYLLIFILLIPQISIAEEPYNVVFHINDASRLDHLNSNIRNLKTSMNDNVNIVVVFNGRAVTRLTKSSNMQGIIDEMSKNGAELLACSNALKNNNIPKKYLAKGVTYPPKGGVEKM